jgi:hypothetical protein
MVTAIYMVDERRAIGKAAAVASPHATPQAIPGDTQTTVKQTETSKAKQKPKPPETQLERGKASVTQTIEKTAPTRAGGRKQNVRKLFYAKHMHPTRKRAGGRREWGGVDSSLPL